MITHTIVKHKPRVKTFQTYPPVLNTNVLGQQQVPTHVRMEQGFFMGKFKYAEMVRGLRLKKGDHCFFKGITLPVNDDKDVYKVVDINEVFYLDRGNKIGTNSPTPYLLRNKAGDERYANDDLVIKLVAGDE